MTDKEAWRFEYLKTVMPFLKQHDVFEGGHLCEWCRDQKMDEPWHHNEWVSMPQVLESMGLIEALGKTKPTTRHSHIGELTKWKSLAFRSEDARQLSLI